MGMALQLFALVALGSMLIAGCFVVADDDDNDDNGCLLVREQEPNDTELTAQFLGDMFLDDCFLIDGSIFDALDVDSYRVLVQEDLTLVVTLDHSPLADFDIQIFDADTGELVRDCGANVVPEVCVVPFAVPFGDIAVDVVVTPVVGAGTYTLELNAQ